MDLAVLQTYVENPAIETISEPLTPLSFTDDVSTEDLDEHVCQTISSRLSEEESDRRLLGTTFKTETVPSWSDQAVDEHCRTVKVRVGFDITRKGERSLVVDGYKFTKSRDGLAGRVFWRCSRRECKATAVTVADRVEHLRAVHSHDPPLAAEFFGDNSIQFDQHVKLCDTVSNNRERFGCRKSRTAGGMDPNKISNRRVVRSLGLDVNNVSNDVMLQESAPRLSNALECAAVRTSSSASSTTGFTADTLNSLLSRLVVLSSTPATARSQILPIELSTDPTYVLVETSAPAHSTAQVASYPNNNLPERDHRDQPQIVRITGHNTADPVSSLKQLAAIATSFPTNGRIATPESSASPASFSMNGFYQPVNNLGGPSSWNQKSLSAFEFAKSTELLGEMQTTQHTTLPHVSPTLSPVPYGLQANPDCSTRPSSQAYVLNESENRTVPGQARGSCDVRATEAHLNTPYQADHSSSSLCSSAHPVQTNNLAKTETTNANTVLHWKKGRIREPFEDSHPQAERVDSIVYTESITGEHSPVAPASNGPFPVEPLPRKRRAWSGCSDEGVEPKEIQSCRGCCIHLRRAQSPVRTAEGETHESFMTDIDQIVTNQIQNGILMKVLSVVQQLTDKLDADADPSEVIQNCRAIQACLDTIGAIKRARLAVVCPDSQDFQDSS